MESVILAGPKDSHGPRHIGGILDEVLLTGNEPLAVAYRKRREMGMVEHFNADKYGKE